MSRGFGAGAITAREHAGQEQEDTRYSTSPAHHVSRDVPEREDGGR
jgi:hypothetical protein